MRNSAVLLLAVLCFLGAGRPVYADLKAGVEAIARRDYVAAFKAFKPLAAQGDVAAQVNLGNLYMKGLGVKQDYAEAARWYRRAAAQDERLAQSKLGILHYYGLGVEQDAAEAARWFLMAAQQGEGAAQAVLGSLYAQGEGVAQDYAQSYYWYSLAAEQGSADAEAGRRSVADDMTPGQMDEALRLLAEFKRKTAADAERELDEAVSGASATTAGSVPDSAKPTTGIKAQPKKSPPQKAKTSRHHPKKAKPKPPG